MNGWFFHILGMSSSQLTNSIILQRGRYNHQPATKLIGNANHTTYKNGDDWIVLPTLVLTPGMIVDLKRVVRYEYTGLSLPYENLIHDGNPCELAVFWYHPDESELPDVVSNPISWRPKWSKTKTVCPNGAYPQHILGERQQTMKFRATYGYLIFRPLSDCWKPWKATGVLWSTGSHDLGGKFNGKVCRQVCLGKVAVGHQMSHVGVVIRLIRLMVFKHGLVMFSLRLWWLDVLKLPKFCWGMHCS